MYLLAVAAAPSITAASDHWVLFGSRVGRDECIAVGNATGFYIQ